MAAVVSSTVCNASCSLADLSSLRAAGNGVSAVTLPVTCVKVSKSAGTMRCRVAQGDGDVSRRLAIVLFASPLALSSRAGEAQSAYGGAADSFSSPTSQFGFTPDVGEGFQVDLPAKFPGQGFRDEGNFDATNNLSVSVVKTDKSSIEEYGSRQELLKSFRKPLCETAAAAACSQHRSCKPAIAGAFSDDSREQERTCRGIVSRREWLLLSGSLAGVLAVPRDAHGLSKLSELGDNNSTSDGSAVANANGGSGGPAEPRQQQQPAEDVKSWYRYRGEGFVVRVPPGYEDVLDYDDDEDDESDLYGKRAKDKPFLARFASPDRDEVLSIVVKPVSQLRLSFFETTDITDFGSIKEAAPNFVPAGAKLVSARIINSKASRVPRTYYMYEFLMKGMHFALSAGVSKGRVFVLGASTPQAKWKDYGNRLQLASSTFYLP